MIPIPSEAIPFTVVLIILVGAGLGLRAANRLEFATFIPITLFVSFLILVLLLFLSA
ncbi:hypothetical protein HS7_03550 [Sulfolobales archaeon HS-7]|nr:hypothetical protein HS7_03550 [Sulfolobales archaeon HS-7]